MPASTPPPPLTRLRKRVLPPAIEAFYRWTSSAVRRLPVASPRRHGVEVIADLPYSDSGRPEHTLDVYRPTDRTGPLPVVVYVHGGAFRSLSKDTHWIMALAWARAGYVVFNVDYRLAPAHRYPAACEDLAVAWRWVSDHAAEHGGDPDRLVVSGESAGGNLAVVVALASCVARPEPWAQAIHAVGRVPSVVVPACAILQVSDPQRWTRRRVAAGKRAPRLVQSVLDETWTVYSGQPVDAPPTSEPGLIDPLRVAEALSPDAVTARPLPAFFLPVGVADPLLDDHRRMEAAVRRLGGVAQARFYPGMEHAFHAFVWRRAAQRCWRDTFAFTATHLAVRSAHGAGRLQGAEVEVPVGREAGEHGDRAGSRGRADRGVGRSERDPQHPAGRSGAEVGGGVGVF